MKMFWKLLLLILAICVSGQTSAAEHSEPPYSILATEAQSRLEERVLRVSNMPVVTAQLERSRAIYAGHALAQTDSCRATLDAALSSISFAMLQLALNDDPTRPQLFWVVAAAHNWMGRDFPNAGYCIETMF